MIDQDKNNTKINVFYDGLCSICSREINYYKKIANARLFQWHDIANHPELLDKTGISQKEALRQLHVRSSDESWHIGIDAFICIWKHLPRWRVLGNIASLPLIHGILGWAYIKFANYRFKRLKHCQRISQD